MVLRAGFGLPSLVQARKRKAYMKKNGFTLLELLIVVAIILIIAVIAIPSLLRSRQAAQETHAVANLKTVNTAEVQYMSNMKTFGGVPELITAGLLDARFSNPSSGYIYDIQLPVNYLDYTAIATAQSANAGRYDYFTKPDFVIRFSTDPTRAPTGLSGEPVR
jgi:prepilin-type N-terminal cleavage/methylation domain-containing protein